MDETLEKSNRELLRPLVGTIFLCPESAQKSADAWRHISSSTSLNAARGLVPAMRVLTSLMWLHRRSCEEHCEGTILRRCCCARLVGSLVLLQACQRGITMVGGGFDAFL